jgi:hypothetical protein
MSLEPEPVHLNNHHRAALAKIFQHPVSHNLEWKDAISLMSAVANVEEKHDGKFVITLGSQTQSFERPKHKDLAAQEVLDLRRLLSASGFEAPK